VRGCKHQPGGEPGCQHRPDAAGAGGYFPFLPRLEVNLFIQVVNLQHQWWLTAVPTMRGASASCASSSLSATSLPKRRYSVYTGFEESLRQLRRAGERLVAPRSHGLLTSSSIRASISACSPAAGSPHCPRGSPSAAPPAVYPFLGASLLPPEESSLPLPGRPAVAPSIKDQPLISTTIQDTTAQGKSPQADTAFTYSVSGAPRLTPLTCSATN
jgi:hypothetical protein